MKTLWIDASAGAAGDMICGALVDAGGDAVQLEQQLRTLDLGDWNLRLERVKRGALEALHFVVDEPPSHPEHHHPHRKWADIRNRLASSALPPTARERALRVFGRLAEAEASVHGVPVDDVSFHEVGALDSIVDIVGACLLLDQLEIEHLVATPLPLGSGTVQTAHGPLPVPVPAVIALLKGWPTTQDGRIGELVTPTGAALLTTLAVPGPMPAMTLTSHGLGAGTRNPTDRANVVRAAIGTTTDASSSDSVEVLEAQVDDMPGEWIPPLLEALFSAGALDAWAMPVLMKKGRPGLLVSALARAETAAAVGSALLHHSTTFGVRRTTASRQILDRRWEKVETPYGTIRMKIGVWQGEVAQVAPEYEDVAVAARTAGVPVSRVQRAALAAWEAR